MDTVFTYEILEDGTIKITTDDVAAEDHVNAEALMKFIEKHTAGGATRTARKDGEAREQHTHRRHEHSH